MSNVGSVTTLPPSSTTSSTGNASSTLTQADFLQLMVAQMTQQDPLAGGDSGSGGGSSTSDYVNQLMSMTNLTTMQTMSSQQGVALAQQLPGATVSLTDSSGNQISGVVTGTTVSTNGVSVTVNGVTYPATDITGIKPATNQNANTSGAAGSGS